MPKEQKSPSMSHQITEKLMGQSHVVGVCVFHCAFFIY